MNLTKKTILIAKVIILCILTICISASYAEAQTAKKAQKPSPQYKLFPDEYSELDDAPVAKQTSDETILRTLERSRQRYLQALILVERGDTTAATRYFDDAINILNKLVNYPNIENNEDFSDLAQKIIEDYENFVQNIDNLDENTPLFIIRDKLFRDIETYTKIQKPQIDAPKKGADSLLKPSLAIMPTAANIPLTDNEYVQRSISYLTTQKYGIKFFYKVLERSTKYFPMMRQIAREEGLPEEFAYLAMIESGLNPHAVSRAKAVGLWQFIGSTGEMYALNSGKSIWLDERRDPEKATRAAMRHLRDLYAQLGDWHMVMAAYNCGLGCVFRAINRSKKTNPNYWDIWEYLPRETRNYVPLFIATAMVAVQPEAYGFKMDEVKFQPEYKYDIFPITEPVNLSALAKCANISIEELRDYNPELIKSCTPPDKTSYNLKIPQGSLYQFSANFAALTPDEKQPLISHTVAKGETLAKIASNYGVSPAEIAQMNNLKGHNARLKVGTRLQVPIDSQDFADNAKPAAVEQRTAPSAQTTPPSVTKVTDFITHVVQRGETLFSISRQYNVNMVDIRNLNNLSYDIDRIDAGSKLLIPKKLSSAAANSMVQNQQPQIEKQTQPKQSVVRHKVKRGETLAKISDDYNVSMESIRQTNNMRNSKIMAGQVLKIQTGSNQTQSNEQPKQNTVVHKVLRGETLSTIAANYGVSESDLIKWNNETISGTTVFAGTRLKIHTNFSSKGSAPAASQKVNVPPKFYVIRKGDTLSEISQKFGISIEQIKRKNKNLSENRLIVGQKIRLQ